MDYICRELADSCRLVYAWFEAMHTRMDMIFWDRNVEIEAAKALCADIESEFVRIEGIGSCFIDSSEISLINSAPAGLAVPVSEEIYDILSRCMRYNVSSKGYFDVTALQGRNTKTADNILLEGGRVSRIHEDVKINLSGFLKGYALDRASAKVREAGIANALLNFGNSSVKALGNHPQGDGWTIENAKGEIFSLKDSCLTSSGNADRERKHIINPLTGNVITGRGMVSVVTFSAEEGEVQSTVGFIRNNIKTEYHEN